MPGRPIRRTPTHPPGRTPHARTIGVNTWVWTSPLTDATARPTCSRHVAALGFDAVELPLENAGRPGRPSVLGDVLDEHRPDAVRRRRDGAGPRPRRRPTRRPSPPRRTTCGRCIDLAAAHRRRAASCGPFYAADRARLADDRRRAGGGVRRAARAPRPGRRAGGARRRRARHRAAQPLRDLARQHRRPGARPRSGRCSGRPSGWRWTRYHLNIEERSQRRRHPRAPASTSRTCRSAATTAAPPGGDQTDWPALLAALDDVGYAGPLGHRELHRRQRLHRDRRVHLAPAGRRPRTTWPATGWRSCGRSPDRPET